MRQERAEQTRIALIMAAASVFDRFGYERATLTGVSDTAMVSKGALFFHFANKSELADTVQSIACSSSRSRLDALSDRSVPALQTVIDMTHDAADQLIRDPISRAGMRLAVERHTAPDPATHLRVNWQEAFQGVVRRAETDRSMRAGLSTRTVAAVAFSLVTGAQAAHLDQELQPREWLTDAWEMLLSTVASERCPWSFRAAGVPAARQAKDDPWARAHAVATSRADH
jgi:AcrR family transcriptional regulator